MSMNTFLRLVILFLSLSFYGCKKDHVSGTSAQLKIINASPNAGEIELLQNLKSVARFSYITGINPTVNYTTIDSGFNNYKLRKAGSEIASWLFANEGTHLSFFVCDSMIPSKASYFFLTDDLDTTGLGKQSMIRLVHTSPDISTIDLVTTHPVDPGKDSVLVNSMNYFGDFNQADILTASGFQHFYADTVVYIKIRKKSNSSILKQYQFNFPKGSINTLLLKGYAGRAGVDSLSLSIIRHN